MYNCCIYALSKYTSGMVHIVGSKAGYICVLHGDACAFEVDVRMLCVCLNKQKFDY